MQLGAYLSQYTSTFVKPFVRPSTAECYRRAYAAIPDPILSTDLSALDGMQLQAMLNAKAAMHPRAAQLLYSCLHRALAKAVVLGYIARNPSDACVKPVHHAARTGVLTADQLAQYLQQARSEPTFVLLLLMATCGLRRGEALGLCWSAVDLQEGTLQIRQQRLRVGGVYAVAPLKSAASRRTLSIGAELVSELRACRSAQRLHNLRGFLCDTNPSTLYKAHCRVLRRCGLPHVSLHSLRHSMATTAAGQGCPIKILQGILGHAKYDLTADLYANHLSMDVFRPHLDAVAHVMLI